MAANGEEGHPPSGSGGKPRDMNTGEAHEKRRSVLLSRHSPTLVGHVKLHTEQLTKSGVAGEAAEVDPNAADNHEGTWAGLFLPMLVGVTLAADPKHVRSDHMEELQTCGDREGGGCIKASW